MHLVHSDHPLQFFVGRDDAGHARVVIRGTVKPQRPHLSGLVVVDRFEDQSGKWNLTLALQDAKFEEVFVRLADHLHARTASAPNEAHATDQVSSVIEEWRRLLRARPLGVLTMEELRGLVGELWLVLNWFTRDRSLAVALEGWLGPLGLPQDFWYEQDGHHEAKCIGPSTTRVRISSAEQLDPPEMQLLVLLVAGTDEAQAGAINLPNLVGRVRAALAEAGESDQPLRDRLEHMGVDLEDPFYRDTWFVVSRVESYRVDEDFPAIRASELPDGIEAVRYQVALGAVTPARTASIEVG
jgi:hypothetical protein